MFTFNACDYAIGFERMTFGDRYIRFPLYYLYDECKMMEQKHMDIKPDFLKEKRDFCSFTISNEKCLERIEMFKALSNYKKVDSGGRYLNNIGSPVKDKFQFDMRHKFSIVFENCSYDGYCTEKLIQAYAAKTVPIYWGDPQSSTVFNRQSYINVHNFSTFEDVVDEVRKIDLDDTLYLKMLRTPALVSVENSYETKSKELESFLTNIFNQDVKVAQRRTLDALETQRIQKAAILYRNLPFHKKLFAYIQRHLCKKLNFRL